MRCGGRPPISSVGWWKRPRSCRTSSGWRRRASPIRGSSRTSWRRWCRSICRCARRSSSWIRSTPSCGVSSSCSSTRLAVRELGQTITTETQERLSKTQREYYLREQLRSIQRELGEDRGRSRSSPSCAGASRRPTCPRRRGARPSGSWTGWRAHPLGVARSTASSGTYLEWMASLPWSKLDGGTIDIAPGPRRCSTRTTTTWRRSRTASSSTWRCGSCARSAQSARRSEASGDAGSSLRRGRDVPAGADVSETPGDARASRSSASSGRPGVGKTSLGQIDRARARPQVRADVARRRPRRGGDPRPPPDVHRRASRPHHPGDPARRDARSGVHARRDRQARGRLARRPVVRPARGARSGAEPHLRRQLPRRAVRPVAGAVHRDREHARHDSRAPASTAWRSCPSSGYTDEEKVADRAAVPGAEAARRPRPARRTSSTIDAEAVRRIVRDYTREAGVRSSSARSPPPPGRWRRRSAEGQSQAVADRPPISVTEYLGRPRFFDEVAERTDRPGVATGLAWTPTGGDVLFVEATMMPEQRRAADAHRHAGRRDARERAGGGVLRALERRGARHRSQALRGTHHPRARAGRGDPEGRPVGRRHHRDRAGLARHPAGRCATTSR